MASGETTTTILSDSLDDIRHSARTVREDRGGVIVGLVDKQSLPTGTGLSWKELRYEQLTAQSVSETTIMDNPQSYSDSVITGTPTLIGIMTKITDRVAARINPKGFAELGKGPMRAINRKKNGDGLAMLDGFTGFSQPGAGSTLASGHVAAAVANIQGNSTEEGPDPIATVLHGYQLKDLYDEFVSPVGTYDISNGESLNVYKNGFTGKMINGSRVFMDNEITIDSSNDAKGGAFSSGAGGAIILVQGRQPRVVMLRDEKYGGGASEVIIYDEFVYLERRDVWGAELYSDATAPTS